MILYIDESGDTNYFVVAGVLVKNESSLLMAHKSFTKHVKSFSMKDKDKRKIFTEFKSTLIDDSYPAIKKDLLNHLIELNPQIIYSYTELSGNKMYQETKENEYIKSLKKIVNYINEDVAIYFDRFNKSDFEKRIISELQKLDNVILIDKKIH